MPMGVSEGPRREPLSVVADETYANPDWGYLRVMVPWPSGDRVVQVAQRREAGEYYIELDTPITLPGPVDAHQCLEFNARTIIGMLCMVDD